MSTPPATADSTVGVQTIYGPFFIGAFLSTFLYGVNLVQMFTYYETCQRDRRWMKMFILYLFIALTLDSAFNIILVYQPLLIQCGQLKILTMAPFFLRTDAVMTVAISTPVQVFMAWRIGVLTKNRIVPAIIVVLAIVSFLGGVATTIAVSIFSQFAQFQIFRAAPITWLVSTAVVDVMITITLGVTLRKGQTGAAPTDAYIGRLIRLTVQTGSITTVAAVANIIVFSIFQEDTYTFIWDLSLAQLYINTTLSSLNTRCTPLAKTVLFSSSELRSTELPPLKTSPNIFRGMTLNIDPPRRSSISTLNYSYQSSIGRKPHGYTGMSLSRSGELGASFDYPPGAGVEIIAGARYPI